ncbi:MAG: bifunctional UDP-N-acetylglucosamine diphosphorylase/glucosamine-1-phosphate N-acetyltransferase GlmU [Bdellovibrionales bacterium]|jgi:bifunctional UDP-N-acetylglucosamine pyrophosphorylase/glucosamine-1-phosphate N-acetyltransferase|nr:bifunctional UDP-N-acetylglucosamine diphosphorylase/glucosamine-1-phosphate N-acetyltransferase GlmU [Bdellovibrionales bacterium]
MSKKIACIILAAGKGTRMKSALPKPLLPVAGLPMVQHVIAAAEGLSPERIVVVIGDDMQDMAEAVRPHQTAIQSAANGTGGAALAAREALAGFDGDVLVVFGDSPLITTASLERMVDIRRQFPAVGLVFSGMRPADPARYGRMVMDDDGTLKKIVEFKDASAAEKDIKLCNGGIVAADGAKIFDWLAQIGNDNAQGEYYLTDLPPIARKDNRQTLVVEIDAAELAGANTRVELAALEMSMQQRLREKHMLNGATLTDPQSVFFCADTEIGQDVTIGPNVVFGPHVRVGDNVDILPFCHIEGAEIAAHATIGPFARLRPGSRIGEKAKVGNFVETKNTRLGAGAKANHLTYLGDADIGDKANIGAGVITCNYDGFLKYKTTVGDESFIGSNTALVAPVTIGTGAIIGAGSTITQNVPENALGITRAPQINKDGWAPEFRQKKMKEKAKKS